MDSNQLTPMPPSGFDLTEPPEAAIPPPPEGFDRETPSQAAPPPKGFDFAHAPQEVPPPPSGFDLSDNPLNPAKSDPVSEQKTNTEAPGFWQTLGNKMAGDDPLAQQYLGALTKPYQNTVGTAFAKGATGRVEADVGAAQAISGTKSPEQQFQESAANPPPEDEVDRLLKQKVFEGWSDPKWIAAQIAHGTGGMVPGLGAGMVGGIGGVPGAVAGFAGEAAWGSFIPAYKAARASGLDPDAATKQALIDSGISAAVATAMGIAPGISLFGKTVNPAVTDQVAQMLKRPTLEAIAQLGLVQPSLGVAGEAIKTLSHGETPGAEDALTNFVTGVGMGAVPVGMHLMMRGNTAKAVPSEPPATPEQVQASFQNQVHEPVSSDPGAIPLSTPEPELSALENTLYPKEQRIFYSPTTEAIRTRVPDNASVEQVISTLRNSPGVKEEELLDLNLPNYLASVEGKVNKADLLAHIESNGLILEEAVAGNDRSNADFASQRRILHPDRLPEYPNLVLPGEHSNYREFILKVPPKGPVREFRDLQGNLIGKDVTEGSTTDYINAHWPEDVNPIAHIRTTDRSDRDGRTLLHVEEIQSDLHQAGRSKGYRDPNALTYAQVHALRKPIIDKLNDLHLTLRNNGVNELSRLDHPEIERLNQELVKTTPAWRAAIENQDKLPNLPFKTTWPELAVKRILRLAADEGYDGVSWSNGEQIGLRQGTSEQLAGSKEFYDKMIPKLFQKWAKKLGMDSGTTKLEGVNTSDLNPMHITRLAQMGLDHQNLNDRNGYVGVNPAAGSRIRQGLPLYEEGPQAKGQAINDVVTIGLPKELQGSAKRVGTIMRSFAKRMGISKRLQIIMEPNRASWRGRAELEGGRYKIRINTNRLRSAEDLYATAAHELGHIIQWDHFALADDGTKTKVFNEFQRFRESVNAGARTVGDVRRLRDNAISEVTGARNLTTFEGGKQDNIPLSDLNPRSRAYLLHFNEWFAEQTAKWATTSEKPLGLVDKWFKTLGRKVREILQTFVGFGRGDGQATPAMQGWLDSLLNLDPHWSADIKDKLALDTTRKNADALSRDGTPEVSAVSQTASTGGGRNIIGNLPPSGKSDGPAMAAHADRMNKFYEWMTSLPQIAGMNLHIRGLQLYKEIVSLMNLEKNNIMGDAWSTLRQWKAIRDPKQLFGLNKFIEDYANGFFKLVDDGLVRRPTQQEFQALAQKHKLSGQSLRMFDKLLQDFDGFLEQYRGLLLADAARIKDPQAQLQAIQDANKRIDDTLQKPFFPLTRFGKYTVTVYDHAGNVKHFEQTDSLRKQAQIAKALEVHTNFLPGDRVRTGEVPKDATPLLGMPPGLIDLVADKLNLSTTQRGMLDQLRFDYAPSQSFRHQFRSKDVTPGYSTDFQRGYAHFFFHGANHITRVKWVDALRDQIRSVKSDSILLNDANKRDQIANYMTEHLNMLVDPKPDFAALRGLMFHWFLGFNPASATLNLSQTAIMTHPHLSSKFGDLRSLASIARAGTELNNFYKKGTIQEAAKLATPGPQGAKIRALAEAVKEGVISETQAHTLAAVSEDRNLLRAFGSKGEEVWQRFSEASSWMFEMTEQYNRRVAFRAAWELGMRDANNRYVAETVRDNPLQYKRLRDQGWSHQEAAAFTAAKDSVEKTQFVYAPYARPKFMWGKKGALFIFKSFVQNTLFNLWHNPSMAARSLLVMGALGGMMGLPGTEDVNGILKALAWRLFGKDFDLEDEARKFAVDVLHGAINPDILLHGMSVHGFGIPHVLNSVGAHVGLPEKWFPTLDRSRSIGMGNILPFEPGKLFGPTKDAKGQELQQLQRSAGAGFGNAFAIYNFLTSEQDIGNLKRWEGIMPKAMSNVSHAFRFLTQGKETNRAGNSVVKFDVNDTEQMAEILARAAGYQPRRLSGAYEAMGAKSEAATFWDLRRGILLRQFGEAVKGGNPEERNRVLSAIRGYNAELPQEWKPKGISASALKESVMNRLRVQQKTEAGLPLAKTNTLGFRNMDKYFPDGRPTGQTDARPVK